MEEKAGMFAVQCGVSFHCTANQHPWGKVYRVSKKNYFLTTYRFSPLVDRRWTVKSWRRTTRWRRVNAPTSWWTSWSASWGLTASSVRQNTDFCRCFSDFYCFFKFLKLFLFTFFNFMKFSWRISLFQPTTTTKKTKTLRNQRSLEFSKFRFLFLF